MRVGGVAETWRQWGFSLEGPGQATTNQISSFTNINHSTTSMAHTQHVHGGFVQETRLPMGWVMVREFLYPAYFFQ